MSKDYACQLRQMLESGMKMDDALGELRHNGATPIRTIEAIYDVKGVSLGEAKQIFCRCPAWRVETKAAGQLHEEILKALEKG